MNRYYVKGHITLTKSKQVMHSFLSGSLPATITNSSSEIKEQDHCSTRHVAQSVAGDCHRRDVCHASLMLAIFKLCDRTKYTTTSDLYLPHNATIFLLCHNSKTLHAFKSVHVFLTHPV